MKAKLPDYMTPARFVFLSRLPRTLNGKIDRAALPAPEDQKPACPEDFVAPRNATEASLVAVWSQLLRVEKICVFDNFFELGGDSILAMHLVARAKQAGIHFTLKQLFQHQTIAGLATLQTEVATATVQTDSRLING